jgi:hypothetical protein
LESLVRAFEPPQDEQPFDGNVTGRTFKLVRVIRYRNSFLPVIRGRISDSPHGGTTVRVRMTLHLFTALFMAAWLGFVGAGVAWSSLGDLDNIDPDTFLLLGMMLFGVLLPVVGSTPRPAKQSASYELHLHRIHRSSDEISHDRTPIDNYLTPVHLRRPTEHEKNPARPVSPDGSLLVRAHRR